MKSKQWRNIVIFLAVLVVIYLFTRLQEGRYTTPSDAVFNMEADKVGRFVIQEGDAQIELTRWDTLWVVTEHEMAQVRKWRLDNMLGQVLDSERESMISDNPDKWSTYGVDSTGRRLQVYNLAGDLVGDILVGQSRSNWQSSYIREADEDEVYLTRQSIYQMLSADTTFWLEPPPPEPEPEPEEESDEGSEAEDT
jgi:hypothetical protein